MPPALEWKVLTNRPPGKSPITAFYVLLTCKASVIELGENVCRFPSKSGFVLPCSMIALEAPFLTTMATFSCWCAPHPAYLPGGSLTLLLGSLPLCLLEPVKCKSNYPFLIVLLNVIKELTYNSDIQKMCWAYNTMITSSSSILLSLMCVLPYCPRSNSSKRLHSATDTDNTRIRESTLVVAKLP